METQPPQGLTLEDIQTLIGKVVLENLDLGKQLQWYQKQTSFSESTVEPLEEEAPSNLSKDDQES